MRNHYNIILFDGSYILYRNQSVKGNCNPYQLAGSFIQTIVKQVRDSSFTFDVGFIAFDKSPYHRFNILHEKYKDSREKFTWDEVYQAKVELSQLDPESDEAKTQKAKIDHMTDSLSRLKNRNEAIEVIKNLDNYGLHTLRYVGWEADDIARLIVDIYSKDYSILLISIDSDWIGMVNENTDFKRIRHKGLVDFYDLSTLKRSGPYIDMVEYGLDDVGIKTYLQIIESIGISHNDMRKCVKDGELFTEIFPNLGLSETDRSDKFDYDVFLTQLSSFDYKLFPDYPKVLDSIINKTYTKDSLGTFNNIFIYNKPTGINSWYYKKLYDRIRNYSLLQLH